MFKIWFEYDVGQENMIFSTKEDAIEWFNANPDVNESVEYDFEGDEDLGSLSSYELYEGAGSVSIDKLTVYSKLCAANF